MVGAAISKGRPIISLLRSVHPLHLYKHLFQLPKEMLNNELKMITAKEMLRFAISYSHGCFTPIILLLLLLAPP